MDLTFVRHGQELHTLNTPDSLLIKDPSLTPEGMEQAKLLKYHLPLSGNDLIVVSPTRRTLETALLWSNGTQCEKMISPMVSPRLFPQKAEGHTLPCDEMMGAEDMEKEFSDFYL